MRKGQALSAYILVGLMLLLGFVIVYQAFSSRRELPLEPILYPKEVEPVAQFVKQCISQSGSDALNIALSQAGFVQLPAFIRQENNARLVLDEYAMQVVPFWTIPGEERIPPLDYIKSQLNGFVENATEYCLQQFEPFKEEFDVVPLNSLVVETLLNNNNVAFKGSYTLRVVHKPSRTEFIIKDFIAEVPVRFKKMYELAQKIMNFENAHHALENITLGVMSADSEIPLNGLLFECGEKKWQLSTIKQRLQRALSQQLRSVRIKNTNYAPFEMDESVYEQMRESHREIFRDLEGGIDIEQSSNLPPYTPADAWDYFHSFFDVGADKTDMSVVVDYTPSYNLHIDAQPSDYGVLSTYQMAGASEYLRYICVNAFHFTYDVSYPVRVAILDPEANYGLGAVFQFAFPVLIDDNAASRQGLVPTIYPTTAPATAYCNDRGSDLYDIRAVGYLAEGLAASELKDITIDLRCVSQFCTLGKTEADGGVYRLRTSIPTCQNPLIRASKEGYLPAEDFLSDQTLTLKMTKLRPMDLKIVKRKYISESNVMRDSEPLLESDEVSIALTSETGKFTQFKTYPYDQSLELIDDTAQYNAKVVLQNDGNTIGGYFNKNLTISYDDIAGTDTITLEVFEYVPYPSSANDQEDMIRFLGQESYAEKLRPRFN